MNIKVFFKDKKGKENSLITGFNGTIEDAKRYYLNRVFNLGNGEFDYMTTGVKVINLG